MPRHVSRDGNACCGCSQLSAAFGFTGVKVVCGVLWFQSGGNGNGYFTVFVCNGCFRIRIITIQIERVLPGRIVHFVPLPAANQLSALCILIGRFCKYGVLKLLSLIRNIPISSPVFRAVPSMTLRPTVVSMAYRCPQAAAPLPVIGRGTVEKSVTLPITGDEAEQVRYVFLLLITLLLFYAGAFRLYSMGTSTESPPGFQVLKWR